MWYLFELFVIPRVTEGYKCERVRPSVRLPVRSFVQAVYSDSTYLEDVQRRIFDLKNRKFSNFSNFENL